MSHRCRVPRLASAIVLLVACGGEPAGPQEQLSNQPDNFSFTLSNVTSYSSDRNFTWRNTGTRATVTHSSNITSGSSTLTIKDAAGTEVHKATLGPSGTFQTATGASGDWRIELDNTAVSGTLSFGVKKS